MEKNKNLMLLCLKYEEYSDTLKKVFILVDKIEHNFWFQDTELNKFLFFFVKLFCLRFNIPNPRQKYCLQLFELLLKLNKDILYSKEFNSIIHAPWIMCGYFACFDFNIKQYRTACTIAFDFVFSYIEELGLMKDENLIKSMDILVKDKKWNLLN